MAYSSRVRHTASFVAVVVLIGVFVGLFLWSRAGVPDAGPTYNNVTFTKAPCPGTDKPCYYALVTLRNQPYSIPFESHPRDVEGIPFVYEALTDLRATWRQPNATVVFGVPDGAPSEVGIAASQLGRILGDRYGLIGMKVVARVAGPGDDQVDCRYATASQYVILLEQGTPDGVFTIKPNCVRVQAASAQGLTPVVDAFAYRILGVIKTYRPAQNATAQTP